MIRRTRWRSVWFVGLLAASMITPAKAENWPGWRGPRGDGSSREMEVPLRWNGKTGQGIAWRVGLPGEGHASPIVWNDRVFLVACQRDRQQRILLCLDAGDGSTRWQRAVITAPLEKKHQLNSFASSTPCTDGRLVFTSFLQTDGQDRDRQGKFRTPGEMVVTAHDLDGRRVWQVRPGRFASIHGYCSSPVVFEDLVIVNGDHDGDGYLVALDRQTGETRWKVPRVHKTRSYCVPILRTIAGVPQMILSGSKRVAAYDPATGRGIWHIEGPTEQFVASLVFGQGLLFLTGGYPERHLLAIDPTGQGDVTGSHIRWRHRRGAGYVPSPVAVDDYFLLVADNGIASCYLARSGERLWLERLGRHYSSSPVVAEGRVYFTDDDGVTHVVRPGPELDIVATNRLDESINASPAISDGRFFLRGERHLYCLK